MPWTSDQSSRIEAPVRPRKPFGSEHSSLQQGPHELAHRESIERGRQARGLMMLALAVLLFSLWRFGFDRVFASGWWRLW